MFVWPLICFCWVFFVLFFLFLLRGRELHLFEIIFITSIIDSLYCHRFITYLYLFLVDGLDDGLILSSVIIKLV